MKKSVKRILSILLAVTMVISLFSMNFSVSAAEENVASIGDVYYNSVEEALDAATSGQTVIVQKDATITRNVEVKAGVTLLVPHKDGYTGYDVASGNPDVNSSATGYVTDVLYRTLTVNEGVTITVNGNILVSAIIGLKKSGHYRHEVNGNYAQMILNGKINVNNGGRVVANGYIKGSGAIEAFSGAEVRELFVIEHFRGGTHSSYMRSQGVWIANEYDMRNITVEVTIHYGAKLTGQNVAYFNDAFSYNVAPVVGPSEGLFILKSGSKLIRTVEYRDRIGKEAEVYKIYGGGYLGSISIKIYISILPVTVNSSSFVLAMDGDNEFHFYDGEYDSYYNSKAISMKFLPGSEATIHDGATFKVNRYKTSTRDRYSQIVAYRELTDSQFTTNYRYPQGRPSAKFFVENGGTLYVDGELGGEIYLEENATVTKGDNAVFSVTTKESAKLSDKATETYTNDAEFIPPEGYHTRWNGNQLAIEKHTYGEATVTQAPTCTSTGTGAQICTLEGCGASQPITIPATGHSYKSVVTAPTCTAEGYTTYTCSGCGDSYTSDKTAAAGHEYKSVVTAPTCADKGYTTYTCSGCGDSYVGDYVDAKGHTYGDWKVTDATCTADGSKTKSCAGCGDTVTEKISATGHTEVTDEAVAPDCENKGLTVGSHCSVCGEVIAKQETVPALGHSYESTATAPTCENKGYTTNVCTVCGDTYVSDYVDALGHTEVTETNDATCTENGKVTVTCTTCGEVISEEEIIASGHKEKEAIKENEVSADCTTNGSYDMVVYCEVCGEEISRIKTTVDALGHTEVTETIDATCTENGKVTVTCTTCGEVISEEEIIASGHKEKEAIKENEVSADCTTNGSYDMVVYCEVCGEEISRIKTTVDALGHTEVTETIDATCTENGKVTVTCTTCGEVISEEEIIASGHKEKEAVKENEVSADCTTNGSYDMVVYCEVCGKEISREKNTADAYGHEYELSVASPTCTEKGYTKYECSVCGDTVEDAYVDALGHTEVIDDAVAADCENSGLTEGVHCSTCGEVIVKQETVPANGHSWSDWSEPQGGISRRECSSCGAEEQQNVEVGFDLSQLKLLRGAASIKSYKGEEYIAITMDEGRTMTGLYKDMTNGGTVEITDICGNVQVRENDYVAYQSQNKTNPVAVMTVTCADGTTETFPVVFELYNMEREIDFDPSAKIKPIRGKVSLATDAKGDYILVEMLDGQSSVGVYKASLDGTTATLVDAEGMFTEQEKLYIFYGSQNTFNPEGRLVVTEADGSVKTYRAVFKMYEMDPYVNAAKGLRPVRGAVLFDADGTIRVKMTKGQTSVGLYKTMANGATFQLVDANGKVTNNPSSIMFYMTNNPANVTATMIFTLPDGTTKEQKIIFDMGLADNPDPLVYLSAVRGTVSYQNDGTEDYIEVKANEGSSGVGLYKDCLVKYTITDADGAMSENDSRYYIYKSQNPDGMTAKINFLQSDGSYKTYTVKFVF